MKMYERSSFKKSVAILSLAALCCCVTSSSVRAEDQENPSPGPQPWLPSAAAAAASNTNNLLSLGNAQKGGNDSNILDAHADYTQAGIYQTDQRKINQAAQFADNFHDTVESNAAVGQLSTGEYIELVTKAHAADMQVFADAEYVADVLTYAIMKHYESMPYEQAVAEWVEDGRSYGFVPENPAYTDNGGSHFFSLISPAHATATVGTVDPTPGLDTDKPKGDLSALQDGPNGGVKCSGGKQSSQPYKKARACGVAYRAGEAAIDRQAGEERMPSQFKVAEDAIKWHEYLKGTYRRTPKVHRMMKRLAWYSGASSGSSSAFFDPSSLLISKAYAMGQVSSAISKLGSDVKNACSANQAAKIGKGTCCDDNSCSAAEIAVIDKVSLSQDANLSAARAEAGARTKHDTQKDVDDASGVDSKNYEPGESGD